MKLSILLFMVLLSTVAAAQQGQDASKPVAFFAPADVAFQSVKEMKLPEFPANAPDSGRVILRFVITPEGSVGAVQDLLGDEPFLSASIAALKQWKFESFRVGEKKVTQDVASQIGFSFGRPPAAGAGKDVKVVGDEGPQVRIVFPFGDFSHAREEEAKEKAAEAAQKVAVSGGVMQGKIISQPRPKYPPDAKANHIQGTVVLQGLIGRDGSIKTLSIAKSPDKSLAMAAVGAVKQWRYRPYTLQGEPVAVDTQIQVNFTLGP